MTMWLNFHICECWKKLQFWFENILTREVTSVHTITHTHLPITFWPEFLRTDVSSDGARAGADCIKQPTSCSIGGDMSLPIPAVYLLTCHMESKWSDRGRGSLCHLHRWIAFAAGGLTFYIYSTSHLHDFSESQCHRWQEMDTDFMLIIWSLSQYSYFLDWTYQPSVWGGPISCTSYPWDMPVGSSW